MIKYLLSSILLTVAASSYAHSEGSIYRGMGNAPSQFPSLKTLLNQGTIAKKPDISRYDYNDVYKLKKPLQFMGQSVVLISDEYMSKYVGCCVSEGWGAVFAKTSDIKPLNDFAKKNKCSLSAMDKDASDYYWFNLKKLPKAEYYELSCRERDLEQ